LGRDLVWSPEKRIRGNVLIENQAAPEDWRAVGVEDFLITLEAERSG
jgi:hypothetical protein